MIISQLKIKFILLLTILVNLSTNFGLANEIKVSFDVKTAKDSWQATWLNHGASTWVNIWNYPGDNIEDYCKHYYANGITNLFVQTSRSNTPSIFNSEKLSRIIDSCHKYGIKVIGWTYPQLVNITSDADKLIAAANFRTSTKQGLDGMVANLEHNLSADNVTQYSQIIRNALGPSYPLIACVYSPLNRCPEVKKTPWKVLSDYYDVIAPMAYWNSKYQKYDVYDYTRETIAQIRALTQKPYQNIHVIGDGMNTPSQSISIFLKACHDGLATSASVYPQNKLTNDQCDALEQYTNYISKDVEFKLHALKSIYNDSLAGFYNHKDIASSVTTADFLAIINKQFNFSANNGNLNEVMNKLSLSPDEPISQKNAMRILAYIVNAKQYKTNQGNSSKNWFIPKAYAENAVKPQENYLNYLDLANILWQESNIIN